MLSKTRIFFNWILTVILGSIICTIIVGININDFFDFGFFWIFMAISATLGLIPIVAMLISQNNSQNIKKNQNIKKRIITTQVICYFIIFIILSAISISLIDTIDYLIFLVGLPYLLVGISITLASPVQAKKDDSQELEHFTV